MILNSTIIWDSVTHRAASICDPEPPRKELSTSNWYHGQSPWDYRGVTVTHMEIIHTETDKDRGTHTNAEMDTHRITKTGTHT